MFKNLNATTIMKTTLLPLLASIFLFSCNSTPDEPVQVNIIPKPVLTEMREGSFTLNDATSIYNIYKNPEIDQIIEMFSSDIDQLTGISVKRAVSKAMKNQVILNLDMYDDLQQEGYILKITPTIISLSSATVQGLFHGLQSLKQVILTSSVKKDNGIAVPALKVTDYPRFSWRGMHLDVCRHFMSKDSVLRYIDFLALYKFNTFHWHLTDDQGWRIEIKKYPELTKTGAWRKETIVGHNNDKPRVYDGIPHGGYYTQEEIKEVVEYAADRYITIVPEIEMPGHAQAAIASYPELGVTGKKVEVRKEWGISPVIFSPSEETFRFLEDVLGEVLELFPSEFIHIGGDEAIKDQWKASPAIQKQIRELGLKDEHELQSWFVRRIEKFLSEKGRRLIGWDEILEGGLAPNATVMSWRGTKGGIEAAEMGHDVVMCPTTYCYLDYYQADPESEPLTIGGLLPIEKVYSFEPVPEELDAGKAKHILGAQGNLWTEYMQTFRDVEYMAFPRVTAIAEVTWSQPESRDYADFSNRLRMHVPLFEALDINYSKTGMP